MSRQGATQFNPGSSWQNYFHQTSSNNAQYSTQSFSWSSPSADAAVERSSSQGLIEEPEYDEYDDEDEEYEPAPFGGSQLPQQGLLFDPLQVQRDHMALHQASMQSAMDMQQNMMQTMQQTMGVSHQNFASQQQSAYQQPQLPQPRQKARVGYGQVAQSQQTLPEPQQHPQIEYVQAPPQQQIVIVQDPRAGERDSQLALQHRQARADSERHEARTAELVREAKKVDARLHKIERMHASNREDQQAKDRELAAARLREQQLQQQLLEAEERHARAISEMAATQATAAFDMATLQKIIDEVQKDRISKDDIRQLVGDAVKTQLAGVAKSSDIDSAAQRMEKGLNKLPASASIAQIQDAVQMELEKAVKKVAKRQPQQIRIEGGQQMYDGDAVDEVRTHGQPVAATQNAHPMALSDNNKDRRSKIPKDVRAIEAQPYAAASTPIAVSQATGTTSVFQAPKAPRKAKMLPPATVVEAHPQVHAKSAPPQAQSSKATPARLQIAAAPTAPQGALEPDAAVAATALVSVSKARSDSKKHTKKPNAPQAVEEQAMVLAGSSSHRERQEVPTQAIQALTKPSAKHNVAVRNPQQAQPAVSSRKALLTNSGEVSSPRPSKQSKRLRAIEGPAPTAQRLQIEAAPQEPQQDGMALVRQSKDVSRRSRP